MLLNTSKEDKTYPKVHIPADVYKTTLLDLKVSGERLRFILIVDGQNDSEGKPVTLVYSCPKGEEYTPKTKIGQLILALGMTLGGQVNTDEMISKDCQSKVVDYVEQVNGKVQKSSYIEEVFPLDKE